MKYASISISSTLPVSLGVIDPNRLFSTYIQTVLENAEYRLYVKPNSDRLNIQSDLELVIEIPGIGQESVKYRVLAE